MSILVDDVLDDAFAVEALDSGDIHNTGNNMLTAANHTDLLQWDIQELQQPFNPLVPQLQALDEDQRADLSLRDQIGSDDRFAKRGCRGENAGVMRKQTVRGDLLFDRSLGVTTTRF